MVVIQERSNHMGLRLSFKTCIFSFFNSQYFSTYDDYTLVEGMYVNLFKKATERTIESKLKCGCTNFTLMKPYFCFFVMTLLFTYLLEMKFDMIYMGRLQLLLTVWFNLFLGIFCATNYWSVGFNDASAQVQAKLQT